MSDDIEDVFDKIKRFLNFNADQFDVDMFFLPEFRSFDRSDEEVKGFKVSYHFESGMDKPEIKYEGNIDPKNLKDKLKKLGVEGHSEFKRLFPLNDEGLMDASDFTLEPMEVRSKMSNVMEPYTEINDFDEFSEILIEVPGIKKADILISFSEGGEKLIFSAKNGFREYSKQIMLPFKSSMDNYSLEVNNGLVNLKVKRK